MRWTRQVLTALVIAGTTIAAGCSGPAANPKTAGPAGGETIVYGKTDGGTAGCRFHPRCPFAMAVCWTEAPPRTELPTGQWTHCWLQEKA